MKNRIRDLNIFATQIRITSLKSLGKLGFGHIGGIMSISDLMAVLYGDIMKIDPNNPNWEERDWLVLSKGHSGPALYATLALKGFFPLEEMDKLNQPHTTLPSHCDRNKTIGVDMSTGSLGQGISTAIGVALGNKKKNIDSYTYLIIGDGECNEGQIWEGALFAAHQKVSNLIAFVDNNKKQLDGYTKDICNLGDIAQKFSNFNWFTQEVDGHNIREILEAIEKAKANKEKPSMIVLNTIKGKDCSFAEEVLYNHHMKFTDIELQDAISKLEEKIKNYREV